MFMSIEYNKHKNKRVLVTGGASGIGAAIVKRFIEEGAIVGIMDMDRQALEKISKDIPDIHLLIEVDLTQTTAVSSAFSYIEKTWNRLDILFNNAGISLREEFLDIAIENWNHVLATNLTAPFIVSQHAVKLMRQVDDAVIINTASVSGMVGMPFYLSYNVSKAGIIEMTKTLALELAPFVRVNSICPGYVLTPMQEKEYTQKEMTICANNIPLQRFGYPQEIAALASYLASSEAKFITGQSFVIDGGETAGGLASRKVKLCCH